MDLWKKIFNIEQIIVTIGAMLIVYGIISISFDLSFFTSLRDSEDDFSVTDIFYNIENSSKQKTLNDDIVLIDVSDVYDRSTLAEVIDTVCSCNPSVVGLDIIFEGVKDDTIANNNLISVLNKYENIVSSIKLTDYNSETDEFSNSILPFWGSSTKTEYGYANLTTSSNSDITRMLSYERMLNGRTVYSLPNVIAHKALKTKPDSKDDRFINYSSEEFMVIDAMEISLFKNDIKGKIVLIGATQEEQDMHFTPIGKTSGLHIQAYSVLTCLNYNAKSELPFVWQLCIIFCIMLLTHIIIFVIEGFCDSNSTLKYWKDNFVLVFVFVLIAFILYIDYYLYIARDIYVDIIPCILGVGAINSVKNLYAAIVNTCANIFHINFLKKSIYYDI